MEAESSSTGYVETRGPRALRKACEVFSWKNRDLLDMLRGEQQAHYFNPQWLRGSGLTHYDAGLGDARRALQGQLPEHGQGYRGLHQGGEEQLRQQWE